MTFFPAVTFYIPYALLKFYLGSFKILQRIIYCIGMMFGPFSLLDAAIVLTLKKDSE